MSRIVVMSCCGGEGCPNSDSPLVDSSEDQRAESAGLLKDSRASRKEVCSQNFGDNINCGHGLLILLLTSAPNVLVVFGFSAMGYGEQLYNMISASGSKLIASAVAVATLLLLALYYVLDFASWPDTCKVVLLLIPFFMFCFVGVTFAASFPALPLMVSVVAILYLVLKVRNTCMKNVRRKHFWGCTSACLLANGLLILGIFCVWWKFPAEWPGSNDNHRWDPETRIRMANHIASLKGAYFKDYAESCARNGTANLDAVVSLEAETARAHKCQVDNTTLYLIWVLPALAAAANIGGAMAMFIIGFKLDLQVNSTHLSVASACKLFLVSLTFVLGGFYLSTGVCSAVSVDLAQALVSFMIIGLCLLLVWISFELDAKAELQGEIEQAVEGSQLIRMMRDFFESDWGRAMMMGSVGLVVIPYLFLNRLRQCYKTHGQTRLEPYDEFGTKEPYDEFGTKARAEIKYWPQVGTLFKICLLGELFFTFQVGVAKVTFVFLSWLNDYLTEANASFAAVVALAFVVGFIMFMLPPVPGVPVYIFCGIVVAKQGEELLGFPGSIAAAIVLGLTLKLTAGIGQWSLGYYAGKSVKVQQLIGVDRVHTRALEHVLDVDGFNWGKVAVLVGGPDWPTGVTTGILGLKLGQVLLGTAPVVVVLSPCVLAGAFMSKAEPGVPSGAGTLAGVFLGLASLMQGASMLEAMRMITNAITEHGPKLAQSRPEHQAVEQLTKDEADYNIAFSEAIEWANLSYPFSFLIWLAAFLIYSSCSFFCFKGSLAFENFEVSGHIAADRDDYGLGGDALNMVRPLGWYVLGMFSFGVLLHFFCSWYAGRLAKARLASNQRREGGPGAAGRVSPGPV